MTTYQMLQKMTGADKALVIRCKKAIIGNKHSVTTEQLHQIIHLIQKELNNDSITAGKSDL